MVKACLFDLDGVVFDTEPIYTKFWHNVGVKYCPTIPNFAHDIKGQTLVQIYDKYFAEEKDKQEELKKAGGIISDLTTALGNKGQTDALENKGKTEGNFLERYKQLSMVRAIGDQVEKNPEYLSILEKEVIKSG